MLSHDPVASVIFWVTGLFICSLIGRYLAKRLQQPGVLGELLMGILVGNLCYFLGVQLMYVLREGPALFSIIGETLSGTSLQSAVQNTVTHPGNAKQMLTALTSSSGADYLKVGYVLDMFSRYGLLFLLFLVGLENTVADLKHTGRAALQVAIIGIVAPIVLGFLALYWLLPDLSYQSHLFIASTLSATSIGITAKVLADLKKLSTREARTILGAAMIDDILGLIILALVSGIVTTGRIDFWIVAQLLASSFLFFALALSMGPWIIQTMLRSLQFLAVWEAKLLVAFVFMMFLAWAATVFQLASIVGAFTAGLIMSDDLLGKNSQKNANDPSIEQLIRPFEAILTPLFFMMVGIQVKLESFFNLYVLGVSAALIVAAVLGKLIAGLGAERQDDRFLIGIGMLPRGEVGLVFASVGRTLNVISDELFSAIILMVIATTILTPPLLKKRYKQQEIAL